MKVFLLKRLILEQFHLQSLENTDTSSEYSILNKEHLLYPYFKQTLEKFSDVLTELDILHLFRQTCVYGNGKADFDSLLLCANESALFVKIISFFGRNSKPKLSWKDEFDDSLQG